jgi:copper(I)-binding protein
MKRLALTLSFLVLALAACQQSSQPAESEAAKEALGPETKPGLALSEGRLVLNAVKGNPGAAYFTLANNSGERTEFVAVHIDGVGRAEMHCPCGEHGTMLPVANVGVGHAGAPEIKLEFKPGGHHVMAFDVNPSLVVGGTTEITLTMADGDKLSAPLKVESPGGMEQEH